MLLCSLAQSLALQQLSLPSGCCHHHLTPATATLFQGSVSLSLPTLCREQYELHYSEMALIQIQNALEMKELMVEEFGREAVTALLREEKVSVLAADVLLWRDKTSAIIATVRSHQDSNTVECPK